VYQSADGLKTMGWCKVQIHGLVQSADIFNWGLKVCGLMQGADIAGGMGIHELV